MIELPSDDFVLSKDAQSYIDSAIAYAHCSTYAELDVDQFAEILAGDLEEHNLIDECTIQTVRIVKEYIQRALD